jgi:hypothetical protein
MARKAKEWIIPPDCSGLYHAGDTKIPRRVLNAELRKYAGAGIAEEWRAILEAAKPTEEYRRGGVLTKLGYLEKGRLDGKYRYFNLTEKGKKWLEPTEMKRRMF